MLARSVYLSFIPDISIVINLTTIIQNFNMTSVLRGLLKAIIYFLFVYIDSDLFRTRV